MISIPTKLKKMVAGDYVCKINQVKIAPNRLGDPCLWLYLDVDAGPYKGYFTNIYNNRKSHGNDLYPCIYCQNMNSYSIRFFKALLRTIMISNPQYECTCLDGQEWNEQELVGLVVGVTFKERQFVNKQGYKQTNFIPYRFKEVSLVQIEEDKQVDDDKQANKEQVVDEERVINEEQTINAKQSDNEPVIDNKQETIISDEAATKTINVNNNNEEEIPKMENPNLT